MRTKTLLLTAAVFAAGLGASMAQSVYSVNAVGYVNLSLPAGFSLIANPLQGTNDQLSTVIPTAPDGAQVLTWDAAQQRFNSASVFDGDVNQWFPNGTMSVGKGAFIFLPSAATITFVGEVPQGTLSNPVSANYSLLANIVPQSISLSAASFPAQDGDQYLTWNRAQQRYNPALVYDGDANEWFGPSGAAQPTPEVGEGFFYFTTGGARNWVRSFSVN
jgi:glyoxylate utilization-related uncharacterized protein